MTLWMFLFLFPPLAPQCVAWHSVDKPFAVGYPDGKILLATAGSYETDQPLLLSAFPVSQHLSPDTPPRLSGFVMCVRDQCMRACPHNYTLPSFPPLPRSVSVP